MEPSCFTWSLNRSSALCRLVTLSSAAKQQKTQLHPHLTFRDETIMPSFTCSCLPTFEEPFGSVVGCRLEVHYTTPLLLRLEGTKREPFLHGGSRHPSLEQLSSSSPRRLLTPQMPLTTY
eukprot:Em0022g113a